MYAAPATIERKVLIMSIYELRKMNKEGTVFNAKDTLYTGEYADVP